MLRKGGNISSATSSLTNLPLTPFSSAFQSFLSQSFTLTQQASGVWSAVRMRATGWPDNFADTWELQMLPRASSLLNVSVEAVRRRARFFSSSLSFSSLLVYLLFSCPVSFSPRPSRLLLSTLSFFLSFFFRPSRRHRGMLKLATVDEQCASAKLAEVGRGGVVYFFRFIRKIQKRIFLRIFDRCLNIDKLVSKKYIYFFKSSLIIEMKLKRFRFWTQKCISSNNNSEGNDFTYTPPPTPRVILSISSFPTNFHKIDGFATDW